jgi:hypothetical protein
MLAQLDHAISVYFVSMLASLFVFLQTLVQTDGTNIFVYIHSRRRGIN